MRGRIIAAASLVAVAAGARAYTPAKFHSEWNANWYGDAAGGKRNHAILDRRVLQEENSQVPGLDGGNKSNEKDDSSPTPASTQNAAPDSLSNFSETATTHDGDPSTDTSVVHDEGGKIEATSPAISTPMDTTVTGDNYTSHNATGSPDNASPADAAAIINAMPTSINATNAPAPSVNATNGTINSTAVNKHPAAKVIAPKKVIEDPVQANNKLSYEDIVIGNKTTTSVQQSIDVYKHFIPNTENQTCFADTHAKPFNKQIRGVNLGGWMVLEPWITPSMFYQFLNKNETETAMDMFSFCNILGPKEGNRQLRRHWDAWVTEDIIKELASKKVTSLRLPVGDWMYIQYDPYKGCTDGALEYVDKLLDWAQKYDLGVLIDVHAYKGSQNGFDNSGQTMGLEWTSRLNTYPAGLCTFQHWPIRNAEWVGTFDRSQYKYVSINQGNIKHSLTVIEKIVERYKDHPAVQGLEPVNEPWEFTPLTLLKKFYWDGYLIMKRAAPEWKYVMHDSFRFDPAVWGGFMAGCPDRALDTHIYQAWKRPGSRIDFYADACAVKASIAKMERAFGPVVVGEWSLATDNCAMWLNGFNDNLPGFPMLSCKYVECAEPYMGPEQPGTPLDVTQALQGPYGSGVSGPSWGLCPVGRDWLKEHTDDPTTGSDWMRAPPEAPDHKDATDNVMTNLARRKINAFSGVGHGFFFWNFRTELNEPEWSYLLATDRGWITTGDFNTEHIRSACSKEEDGEYLCIARRDVLEDNMRNGVSYALNVDGITNHTYLEDLHGDKLYDEGDKVYKASFKRHFIDGATCDFGGTAQLVLANASDSDDEYNDDWTDDYMEYEGGHWWGKLIYGVLGVLCGGLFGFVVAMKTNKRFNTAVRQSVLFRNMKNDSRLFTGRNSLFGGERMPFLMEENGHKSNGSSAMGIPRYS